MSELTQRRRRSAAVRPGSMEQKLATPARRIAGYSTSLLLAAAIMGGGGPSFTNSMIIELLGVASLGFWLLVVPPSRLLADRWTLALLLGLGAIATLQLVPLPAAWWPSLPGRDLAAASLRAANIPAAPHPLSLNPSATIQALLATLPGAAIFVAARRAERAQINQWVLIVMLGAAASAILGVIQVSTGNLYFYSVTHYGYPVGWFANRNHEGDFLLVALLLGIGAFRTIYPGGASGAKLLGHVGFFAVCTLATASRTAITLLPLALLASAYIAFASHRMMSKRGLFVILSSAAFLVALLAVVNSVLFRAFARFQEVSDDLRPEIWRNSWVAIEKFWPTGSGLGTFVSAYQTVEPLQSVSTFYINAAHNDFLQLTLELGLVAPALLVIYGVLLIVLAARGWRRGNALTMACSAAILVILLHSLTDYPLRTASLLSIFALLNALVLNQESTGSARRSRDREVLP